MPEIFYKEESFRVIGICMEIHKTLGMGLKEINYKDAMEIEFIENDILYEREKRFSVNYKGKILRNPYYADFIIYDAIILEVKSLPAIMDVHLAQALSYLAVAQQKLAMVINFGKKSLTWKRIVL
ncbi:MAG TPA: GxxExxY protein [Chitinophagaceae bacterium]|nr:GxxExxY protein [Chitinophagaceae bacterium]